MKYPIRLEFVEKNILNDKKYNVVYDKGQVFLNYSWRFEGRDGERREKFDTAEYLVLLYVLDNIDSEYGNKFNYKATVKNIVAEIESTKNLYITKNNFDFPTYKLPKGWRSVLGQAILLSSFVRAYKLGLCNSDHLRKIVEPLLVRSEEGGFIKINKDYLTWYEEYPTEDRYSYVLNGAIFVSLALNEVSSVLNDQKINQVLKNFLISLNKNIGKWDYFGWSKYCLYKDNMATHAYHRLHIVQLEKVVEIMEEKLIECENIKKILIKWSKSAKSIYFTGAFFSAIRVFIGIKNRIIGIS